MSRQDAVAGLTNLQSRLDAYTKWRDYRDGRHPLMFATDVFERFFHSVVGDYRLNLMPGVIAAPSERLELEGWEGDTDQAQRAWTELGGSALANRVHRETLGQGDGYVLVWPAGGNMDGPSIPWPLRADEATVIYDDETPDVVRYGIKTWTESDVTRINVYYPDVVERWQTTDKAAAKVRAGKGLEVDDLEPVDDDTGDTVRHGYGRVPLVHFANGADLEPYGRSELVDVTPVQDALNKHAVDILVASESVGFPLRALLGFAVEEEPVLDEDGEPARDEHGQVVMRPTNLPDYDPRIDRFMAFAGENTRLIQLDAADIRQLVEVKDSAALDIARVSGVPLHYLIPMTGDVPSGEALRVVERRITSKVEDRQQSFGPRWADVMGLLGIDARPRWSDPTSMDVTELWELVRLKVDTGMPLRQALIETGHYTGEEVDEFMQDALDVQQGFGDLIVQAERAGADPADLVR